ncbi:MAG: ABC transporter substrate-binding protein [Tyzzerella sp.]|uniref:ABC transporter substrate-binding protein n=1 Tax=Candidatus Fimicola merdigallinarum TaxID=2840819 RepID=A0A9D9H4K8_9FIRM|nr:ABC transporter substrate-binding protein [Candidatus Fimicola merdigallinarum]
MKKFLATIMAMAMVFSLAGCGSGGNQSSNDDDTFVIGGLGPITGGAASYGISVKQGAEVAINEINEAGGVKVGDRTVKLALNFKDDENDTETCITAYNALMDEGIDALLGTVTSAPCIVIKDYTAQDGILQITPSGSAIDCITDADNVFRLCFTDPLQGKTMADFAVNDLGHKNIAIIFNNSDEYSTGLKDAFVSEAESLGANIVSTQAFNEGDVDFTSQLTAIKNANAEILFVPVYYEAVSYIAQQAKDIGLNLPLIGGDGWDGVLKQVTDTSTVEGAIFLSPFLSTDPSVANFVNAYETAYKSTPDQFAADGYDVVYVMKAAMEKAGSTESADMIKAMTEIEVDGITGKVKFTADGEPEKDAKFVQIKDGQYVAYDKNAQAE